MTVRNKQVSFDVQLQVQGGSFTRKRALEYRVKQGSLRTLYLTVLDSEGNILDMTNVTTYDSGKWNVWRTDNGLVIDGTILYNNRAAGIVEYTLVAADTVANNVGVWEGEIELHDDQGAIVDQSNTFTFIIENSP